MQATISPSHIRGPVMAAASKSAMQRACAAALIRGGKTILHNPGISADDVAALSIITQLGATVTKENGEVVVESNGIAPVSDGINCGESGLSIRMFTSIAATCSELIHVSGSGSLAKRPLNFFDEVLPQLAVAAESKGGYLPLSVKGPLVPKNIMVDGSLSSQYLTGLLFAYAASNATGVTITVENLNSKPYIDLTLTIMKAFGLKTPINNNYKEFYFDEAPLNNSTTQILNYNVEGDWSGAAFLLVAGAIAGTIEVTGLDIFSTQADKAILGALMQAEAIISVEEKKITVQQNRLKAFHFNAVECPDLFPPLVALAAYCEGTSVIEGTQRLTHKESNRALTLQEEFKKLGIEIILQDDLMLVKGGAITGVTVHSRHDHRIAMACAVAGLKADNTTTIEEAEAVNKSYPQFWEHLQQLGAAVSLKNN